MSDFLMNSRPAGWQRPPRNSRRSARFAADWLCLAATPTFAVMALLTAFGGEQSDMLCVAMQHTSPLSGMVLMYLLMSAFHAGPWLKLMRKTG